MNLVSGEDNPAGGESESVGGSGRCTVAQYQAIGIIIGIIVVIIVVIIIVIIVDIIVVIVVNIAIIVVITVIIVLMITLIVIIITITITITIREDKHQVLEQLNIPRNLAKEVQLYLN